MNRIRFLRWAAFASALAPVASVPPAFAQAAVATANPDADALAVQIRVLAQDPRDQEALLTAGELSTRLGDTSAALAFYQRAEAVDPSSPRLYAGRGAALVRLERPGEALTLFARAEAAGLPVEAFASDRGFAYDLLGAPQLAQRDYRRALERRQDDETLRRYALSLGITGKPDEAMAVLDPLLRRSDRAAWRARAFILAMNGDVTGAERIAASMMPGNMGLALTPFFRRLPALSVADRAFAVHFGELSPTRGRIADAQLAPPLPAYVPEPKPVAVAAAEPPPAPAPAPSGRDRRSRRERERDEQAAQLAPAVSRPAPAQQTAESTLPAPPRYVAPMVQPIPAPAPTPTPPPASRPVQLASNDVPRPASAPRQAAPQLRAAAERDYDVADPAASRSSAPPRPEPQPAAPSADADDDAAPLSAAPAPPAAQVGQEDKVLAAIVSGITIPASELDLVPVPATRAAPAAAAPGPAAKPAPKPPVKPPAKPDAKGKDAATDAKAKKPDAKGKDAATDTKGKKPDAKGKKAPAKPDPAKAEPSRVWVQVAGGADEKSLPTTWKKLVKQAPAAFKGKTAWTTPLRATNRLLTGPFKNADAAQDFVNMLKKAGMTGFVFTSDAGQKIAKLAVK